MQAARRSIAAQHQLFVREVQRVEEVEELPLGLLCVFEVVHVVDDQHFDLLVLLLEGGALVGADRLDEFAHEVAGGDVLSALRFERGVGDGLEQVGLAQSGCGVDEEGVVGVPGVGGHGGGGGVSDLVGGTDHEVVEREGALEHGSGACDGRRRRRAGLGGGDGIGRIFRIVVGLDDDFHLNATPRDLFDGAREGRVVVGVQRLAGDVVVDGEDQLAGAHFDGADLGEPLLVGLRGEGGAELLERPPPEFGVAEGLRSAVKFSSCRRISRHSSPPSEPRRRRR